jgi:hypothetical protein
VFYHRSFLSYSPEDREAPRIENGVSHVSLRLPSSSLLSSESAQISTHSGRLSLHPCHRPHHSLIHRLNMDCPSPASNTHTRSRAELTPDVNPRNLPHPHGIASRSKEKRRPSTVPDSGSSTTTSVKRAGDTTCANDDDTRFLEAVSIGESLERGLEAFLPLLESVPPLFRSRRYDRQKNEFLTVKGILSATVRTLKAKQQGDVRSVAQQYLLFKDMIYNNLRRLLLWLDSEMERHKESQQKSTFSLSPHHIISSIRISFY